MGERKLFVDLTRQLLTVLDDGIEVRSYPVSTSSKGAGEQNGSGCTPQGRHIIRAKIGRGLPGGAVLVGRRPTGEVYSDELRERFPERDWILTRILWLSGVERGKNRLGNVDSMRRYIYIHGMPDSEPIGIPGSSGCIRMRNADVMDLFNAVEAGTPVDIVADRDGKP